MVMVYNADLSLLVHLRSWEETETPLTSYSLGRESEKRIGSEIERHVLIVRAKSGWMSRERRGSFAISLLVIYAAVKVQSIPKGCKPVFRWRRCSSGGSLKFFVFEFDRARLC